ncbi:monocarboxylate uptake permease MctP [Micromonospora saelicesensis]|uniref:Monocarboxylate transport permease protein n=1 Tax=Micromonospora saelicesensis TaxID=285676 RepID=A0A1C5AFU6_9ACTN|nr:sodium:solute symporter [Micromonospora saelicesensis]RAN93845.1 Monocarboxylate transport permease protein [Micromonospora saelicesensis]RAO47227.1 Monocarboxylate transport permease protein [Micromonospora saelicesensis]RAO62273.1 Monocarboxylate transport permease protein [Micromonospora saelicesensis]RAO62892.1 Monocarboxylate transport permease protein [Micromonospora saelicesensis]SCF43941.1 solute:Na+ symporter, SSS family [Micromonospora saelicesensis]
MWRDHLTEIIVFSLLFLLVSVMGFVAARWRAPKDMAHLDEWGLGGRSFGGWITWFLVGGDLYTAYTFVAVPALVFGAGAMGFFAVPYTIVIYPLVFLVLCRLWSVSHRHGFVTPADFVRSRFDSPVLALLVAITGIVATMPYIALQLVGIEAVLKTMGVTGDSALARHLPIIIAFAILAAYTYQSGLRAPALIAFVKDALIYVVILVAVIWLPQKLGGWGSIFDAAEAKFQATAQNPNDGILLNANNQLQYVTLAFGSALALFLYPHSITGVLASRNRDVIKRNMSALPAYSLILGLIALLGYMAIASGVKPLPGAKEGTVDNNTVVPVLFDQQFPDWFAGVAYAAIGIGALVPAAIMSIAAANLFTRNIYKEYLKRDASPAQEANVSKITSLVVKVGAVACIVFLDPQFSIDLQLIGGVIILQTLPAVALGLYTRWFHRTGLIVGWVAGMGLGMWMLYQVASPTRKHFGGSAFPLSEFGFDTTRTIYVGIVAVAVNLAVAALVTLALRAAKVGEGVDGTEPDDYFADEGDPRVTPGTDRDADSAREPVA